MNTIYIVYNFQIFAVSPFIFPAENEKHVFNESSTLENITCKAEGFPPPKIIWDENTRKRINDSKGRIEIIDPKG